MWVNMMPWCSSWKWLQMPNVGWSLEPAWSEEFIMQEELTTTSSWLFILFDLGFYVQCTISIQVSTQYKRHCNSTSVTYVLTLILILFFGKFLKTIDRIWQLPNQGFALLDHCICNGACKWGWVNSNKRRLWSGTTKFQDDQLRPSSFKVLTLNILNKKSSPWLV